MKMSERAQHRYADRKEEVDVRLAAALQRPRTSQSRANDCYLVQALD